MNNQELDQWIENSPYTEQEEVVILLRQQQTEIEYWKSAFERAMEIKK
jgi:galactose-1-phosphate uridylyltransferase